MKEQEGKLVGGNKFGEIALALANEKRLINVYGCGGAGKTTFLKNIVEVFNKRDEVELWEKNMKEFLKKEREVEREERNKKVKIIKKVKEIFYVEISGCGNEVDIYSSLVKVIEKVTKIRFKKYKLIYQWYLEERKSNFTRKEEKNYGELVGNIKTIVDKVIEQYKKDINNDDEEVISEIMKILFDLAEGFSIIEGHISLINIVRIIIGRINKTAENKKVECFMKLISECTSEREYRRVLRECILEEWENGKEKDKNYEYEYIFIIDNYDVEYIKELAYDKSWLWNLQGRIGGYWIIGSRKRMENSARRQIELIEINGFEQNQATEYINNYIVCNEGTNKAKKWRIKTKNKNEIVEVNEEEIEKIKAKMLEVCENNDRGNIIYLPYRLNLVVEFYNNNLKNGRKITENDLIKYTEEEEFVNYYYFSHMSEMVIAAVQLLSCLSSWDEYKIKILKERFNYHYIEAEYLMRRCAFLEKETDGTFKLHETIREAVYKSDENIVKLDVLKYLCQKFGEDIVKNNYNQLLHDYFAITNGYLRYLKDNRDSNYEGEKKKFLSVLDEIYENNKDARTVSLNFAEEYMDILNKIFEGDDSDEGKNGKRKQDLEYIKRKLKGADLYTKLYMPDRASALEEECLIELDRAWEDEYSYRIKAYNWTSFDFSKKWEYEKAFEYGKKGLNLAAKYIEMLIEDLRSIDNNQINLIQSLEKIALVYANKVDVKCENSYFDCIQYKKAEETEKEKIDIRELEKCFIIINKEYAKELQSTLKEIKDLFFDQYNKLRGNFPWYVIKCKKEEESGIEPIQYGINTYLIRYIICKIVNKGENARVNMLKSLNNVAVYLFKHKERLTGKNSEDEKYKREYMLDRAILIANDNLIKHAEDGRSFIFQENSIEWHRKQALENKQFIYENNTSDVLGIFEKICSKLYREYRPSEKMWNLSNETFETYSYLGDMYLEKGWYRETVDKFLVVLLNNYVRGKVYTAETMDAYCRCGIAIYGIGNIEKTNRIFENLLKISESDRIQCPQGKGDEYRRVFEMIKEGRAVREVYKTLN